MHHDFGVNRLGWKKAICSKALVDIEVMFDSKLKENIILVLFRFRIEQ
jgi:hypothetical protein